MSAGQGVCPPVIRISDYELEVVHYFKYLGSTISDCLSLDTELNKRIVKAATYLDSQKICLHTYRRMAYKRWVLAYLKSCVLRTFFKSKFAIQLKYSTNGFVFDKSTLTILLHIEHQAFQN